jgi:hypothetical protein
MADSIAENEFKKYTGADAESLIAALPHTRPRTFESTWLEFKSGFVQDEDFGSRLHNCFPQLREVKALALELRIPFSRRTLPPDAARSEVNPSLFIVCQSQRGNA